MPHAPLFFVTAHNWLRNRTREFYQCEANSVEAVKA